VWASCRVWLANCCFAHTDIGYTDLQSTVEEKQVNNLKEDIALARKTATYPEGSRFIWNVEVLWAVERTQRVPIRSSSCWLSRKTPGVAHCAVSHYPRLFELVANR